HSRGHCAHRSARSGARVCRIPNADIRLGDGVDDDVAATRPAAGQAPACGAQDMSVVQDISVDQSMDTNTNTGSTLLEVAGLTMRFGGLLAVDQVAFNVKSDEVFAIIGPNGAGKTTVFNCVGGFYKPTTGTILMDGKNITGLPSHKVALQGLVRTFQNVRLFKHLTVLENLLVAQHAQMETSLLRGLLKLPGYRA